MARNTDRSGPEQARATRTSIAIVDDHDLMRQGLKAILEQDERYTVVYTGDDPSQAASLRPDVSLLDIDLGPNGVSVGQALGELTGRGSHVLLISAYEDHTLVRAAIGAGALGFVPKRLSMPELLDAIERVAGGRLYMSVDLANILTNAPGTPLLAQDEHDALQLYGAGFPVSAIAGALGTSSEEIEARLESAREKYEADGVRISQQ